MEGAPPIDRKVLRDVLRARLAWLAGEVDATRGDEGFGEALRAMARFWRYSPFNQFLIWVQRPEATRLAGRLTWEALGRKVKLGAPDRGPRFDSWQVRVHRRSCLRRSPDARRKLPVIETTLRGRSRHVTAYVILAVLGLDPPSPAYIAWQGGTGDAVLRSLGRVQRAARRSLEAAGCGLPAPAAAPVHRASAAASRQPVEAALQ